MKSIKHFIIIIVINSVLLYVIAYYIPEFGLKITSEYKDVFVVFGVLGILFWFVNSLLKRIIQTLTLPIKYFTLGLSSIVISILLLYVFEQGVNYLDIGIIVQLGSIIKTAILATLMTGIHFLIKKLI